jgi:4-diphosphocytidyl-2-C-methyl-D-erythritol kinase
LSFELVEELAHAKLNLSLDVLSSRTDGYHNLRSVLQTISLHDVLTLRLENAPARESDQGGNPRAPECTAEDFSLVDRAIEAIRCRAGSIATIRYTLRKSIPVGAGLGGGSSDAAAAMRGACRLLGLTPPPSELLSIAASLGSDVPFFLLGGTALVEGTGERCTSLPRLPPVWFLLARANELVSTQVVFSALKPSDVADGLATERVMNGLRAGEIVLGGNDLMGPAVRGFPRIRQIFDVLAQVAPSHRIAMSGSGGTVFATFETESEAKRAAEAVAEKVDWSCVARPVSRGAFR